jgi:hypothetical protein
VPEVAALGSLDLEHRDLRLPQEASEPSAVTAGSLYSGTPYNSETLRPTEELSVAREGRWYLGLAQVPAQPIQDYPYVDIEMCVHAQYDFLECVVRVVHAGCLHIRNLFPSPGRIESAQRPGRRTIL